MKWLAPIFLLVLQLSAETLRVASYNVEFYIDQPALGREPKAEASRRAVRQALLKLNADVLALQEMGGTNALMELRASLEKEGLKYSHWEHVRASDPTLHLAFLSKLPIKARRHHTNESYLLKGRRFEVARGFGEIEVETAGRQRITIMTAHLKSKRQTGEADQQDMREEEAMLLREKIDAFFSRSPAGHLLVMGDLNDGPASRSTRTVVGRGRTKLIDTRPVEAAEPTSGHRKGIAWTHFYAAEETYSRIDYILASPSLREEHRPRESRVLAFPDWGAASDHRPVLAVFELN
jgi:endonuclease/exonuclease/phosphatase family metal-dependent hydrolase